MKYRAAEGASLNILPLDRATDLSVFVDTGYPEYHSMNGAAVPEAKDLYTPSSARSLMPVQ